MSRWASRRALVVLALVSACASQPEDAGVAAEPEAERGGEQAVSAEPGAAADALEVAPSDDVERSLADFERELARNEARLRELGVVLPSTATTSATATPIGGTTKQPSTSSKSAGAGAGGIKPPAPSPSTMPSATERDDASGRSRPSRKDKSEKSTKPAKESKKAKDDADGFAPPPPGAAPQAEPPPDPDQAKAAPPSGSNPAELDAAARCEQVCGLGQITCELSVQICELAERHDDDDDYEAACERSIEDCNAAQEACDVCKA